MTPDIPDLLATRRSLLARLKNADDQTGWRQFFDTYWTLLYRVAIQSGLTDAEAQDAVQETIIAVSQHIGEFRYDPVRCSFKSWLLLLTRQRIVHQFRKRNKPGGAATRVHVGALSGPLRQAEAGDAREAPALLSDGPATVDQIPDPVGERLESIWDAEWERHLLSAALEAVKSQVSDKQFQLFDLYVLQEWPVGEVAATLRVSTAQVYLAKHRVGRLLKKEIQRLQRELR